MNERQGAAADSETGASDPTTYHEKTYERFANWPVDDQNKLINQTAKRFLSYGQSAQVDTSETLPPDSSDVGTGLQPLEPILDDGPTEQS